MAATRATLDRAVAALRRAGDENRPHAYGQVKEGDAVCACYVIAEELAPERVAQLPWWGASAVYTVVRDIGFDPDEIWLANDGDFVFDPSDRPSWYEVADVVAGFDVVDEAEAICRDAVGVPA